MPPHHHHHPPPPHRGHHARDRTLERFVDRKRIDRLLAPWVPDADDRAFVLRCLLDEGPAHHRGANWILLALLGELADAASHGPGPGRQAPVPLRLPPHLRRHRRDDEDEDGASDDDERTYPLRLPLVPLERLAGKDERAIDAMIDCLTDGPPQHALANAAMLALIDAALRK